MKIAKVAFFVFLISLPTACMEVSHPAVDTFYMKGKDIDGHHREALLKLYEHYSKSRKDKEVYEVISKYGRLILNFTPSLRLLTTCGDPGSGWGNQFRDVDEAVLKRLIDEGVYFDDLYGIGNKTGKVDSMLVINSPFYNVKTNGSPSI